MSEADVSEFDDQAVIALLLGVIRAERFCDGALLGFFEDWSISGRFVRLREIDEQDGDEG